MRRPLPPPAPSLASLAALLVALLAAGPAAAVSTTLLISEFRTNGPGGSGDEFVEVYNMSTSPILIGGMWLYASDNAGNWGPVAQVTGGIVLFPGCKYLFANTAGGYSGSMAPDTPFFASQDIPDDGGIAISDGTTIFDEAGMSAGSAFSEGTLLAPLTGNLDRGYERKPGGGLGSGQDTDDNASDFQLLQPSQPENMFVTCTPVPVRRAVWGTLKLRYR